MMAVNRLVCALTWWSFKYFNCCFLSSNIIVLTFLASLQFSFDPVLPQLVFILFAFMWLDLLFATIFPAIVLCVFIFPLECTDFPNYSCSAPLELCLSRHHTGGFSTSPVYTSGKKEALLLCHALLWALQGLFVFISVLQQYPSRTAYTVSHTHGARSELRKQATALT